MSRSVWRLMVPVLVLVAALAAIFVTPRPSAAQASAILTTKLVRWQEVGAIVYTDTTFMTGMSDTTRTEWIDTSDWDWDAIKRNLTGGVVGAVARITFVSRTATSNAVTDTIYFYPEVSISSVSNPADTAWTLAPAMGAGAGPVAAVGTYASSAGTNPIGALAWYGLLIGDSDGIATGVPNLYECPRFRLRVNGDVSGTTPKVSGLACYITYLKRAGS